MSAGELEAVFLPELGMLGSSLLFRGEEYLSLHGGVAALRSGRTNALPLLAPWANRLSTRRFRAAGIDIDLIGVPLIDDGRGLPFAQIYTPADARFCAIEPMTAPTDSLVTGRCPVVQPGDRFRAAFRVTPA